VRASATSPRSTSSWCRRDRTPSGLSRNARPDRGRWPYSEVFMQCSAARQLAPVRCSHIERSRRDWPRIGSVATTMIELEHAELSRPVRIDLVEAEAVEAHIELADCEITRLRDQAAFADSTARKLEARVADERVDTDTAIWMMTRFQAFLTHL